MLSWSIPCSPGQFFPPRDKENLYFKAETLSGSRLSDEGWEVIRQNLKKGEGLGAQRQEYWRTKASCGSPVVIVIVTNSDVVTLSVELFQLAGTGFYRSTHRSMGPPGKKDPEKKQQSSRRVNTELVLNGKKTILYYHLFFFFPLERNKSLRFSSNLTKTNN